MHSDGVWAAESQPWPKGAGALVTDAPPWAQSASRSASESRSSGYCVTLGRCCNLSEHLRMHNFKTSIIKETKYYRVLLAIKWPLWVKCLAMWLVHTMGSTNTSFYSSCLSSNVIGREPEVCKVQNPKYPSPSPLGINSFHWMNEWVAKRFIRFCWRRATGMVIRSKA